jgi:hypothetical protein
MARAAGSHGPEVRDQKSEDWRHHDAGGGIADCGLRISNWSLNSKSQAPNSKQAPISNAPNSKQFGLESKDLQHARQLNEVTKVLNIGYWNFEFVWDL